MSISIHRRVTGWRRANGLGLAALAVVSIALSACSSTNTAEPYTPGVGVTAAAQGVDLRALTVVAKDGKGVLAGAAIASSDDTLTKISGQATGSDFQDEGDLSTGSSTVQLPAGKLVSLSQQKISVDSDKLTPGLYARVTFTFEKAGEVTVLVPVVDASHPDYASVQPQA